MTALPNDPTACCYLRLGLGFTFGLGLGFSLGLGLTLNLTSTACTSIHTPTSPNAAETGDVGVCGCAGVSMDVSSLVALPARLAPKAFLRRSIKMCTQGVHSKCLTWDQDVFS